MSTGTLVLIIKTLLPFLKDILFKDKGLAEFVLSNKTISALAFCLLFVFGLVYYMSYIAEGAITRIRYLEKTNSALMSQIKTLETPPDKEVEVKCPICVSSSPTTANTAIPPPKPPSSKKISVKQYAVSKLKELD